MLYLAVGAAEGSGCTQPPRGQYITVVESADIDNVSRSSYDLRTVHVCLAAIQPYRVESADGS
jgi:hypothetical protein